MSQFSEFSQAAVDYNSTIIGALELSEKRWVLAVQLAGVDRHSRHVRQIKSSEASLHFVCRSRLTYAERCSPSEQNRQRERWEKI